jgi:hypothetical protein
VKRHGKQPASHDTITMLRQVDSILRELAATLGQPPVLETTEMREFEDLGVAPTVNAPPPAVAATSIP